MFDWEYEREDFEPETISADEYAADQIADYRTEAQNV